MSPASGVSSPRTAPSSAPWSRAWKIPSFGWQDLLNTRLLKMLPMLRPHQSVDTYLKRFFKDERVRLAFCFQSKYLGMSPFRCPSLFSILSFLEYEYGVWHPIGGCAAVTAEAMARVARKLGVEICLNEPVEEILFAGRRAVGRSHQRWFASRRCRGGQRRLRPCHGAHGAGPSPPPLDQQEAGEEEILLLDLHDVSRRRRHLRPAASHHSHRERIREEPRRHREQARPQRRPEFLRPERLRHRSHARAERPQRALCALARLASTSEHRLDQGTCRASGNCSSRRSPRPATATSRSASATSASSRPPDWDSRYEIYRGATFNLAHSLDQMLHLRPHNRFEDLDGMYLVGGGTHPGSGLPVIFESARISSRLLLEDLGIQTNIPLHARSRRAGLRTFFRRSPASSPPYSWRACSASNPSPRRELLAEQHQLSRSTAMNPQSAVEASNAFRHVRRARRSSPLGHSRQALATSASRALRARVAPPDRGQRDAAWPRPPLPPAVGPRSNRSPLKCLPLAEACRFLEREAESDPRSTPLRSARFAALAFRRSQRSSSRTARRRSHHRSRQLPAAAARRATHPGARRRQCRVNAQARCRRHGGDARSSSSSLRCAGFDSHLVSLFRNPPKPPRRHRSPARTKFSSPGRPPRAKRFSPNSRPISSRPRWN